MADWSTLPSDLLYGIALKLNSIEDFIHFSAVCHSWNNGFSLVKTKWIANNLTTPWLLLPEPNNINSSQEENPRFDEGHRKILSIGENKCYKLKLPETFGARCWGSAYGWIVMLHLDKRIQLFNPVTKAQLNLPSLQTMPEQPREDELPEDPDEADDWFQKTFLHRFIVLKMPRKDHVDQDEFVVMAIYWPLDHLAYARPGDQAWTPISTSCTCKR
ncbi:F-box protein At2g17036-like [Chenopodium quinoa]|uniref:F-box protein At2g17036-like n=1 Tax=Chenopodium quinoa TaxID=63459 RepID=UPI000B795202|nr:F-box protein At2g17036-like [Chenopodium quinoa]